MTALDNTTTGIDAIGDTTTDTTRSTPGISSPMVAALEGA
mgnify:FL=1